MTQLDLLADVKEPGVVVSLDAYRRRRAEAGAALVAAATARRDVEPGSGPDARQTAHRARMLRHLAATVRRDR